MEERIAHIGQKRYKYIYEKNANKSDPIDQYIADYCDASGIDLGIKRMDEGMYRIQEQNYHFSLKPNGFFMRKGAETINAHDFLDTHYRKVNKELMKVKSQMNNQIASLMKTKTQKPGEFGK